ncbi:alginate export family protein [Adhaeribacter aquaticus]|uniref:alginate export family protein n=1 Tax=Adhaeribacter aquaticus TaxID=299567 RepID=UPI00040E2FE7|nr:alginate export family protein [Adhaeribacter aquaticus]
MKKKLRSQLIGGLVLGFLFCGTAHAQFSVSGQLRTRSELRDGQGTLSPKGAESAFFTSQRTRLGFGYGGYRFKLFTAIQDVRVWGQDASSINRITLDANDGLMVHEAWGEVALLDTSSTVDNFSLKVGRQELVYDDSRLLGNLDWLQQGRRHDLALLKLENNGWIGHLGIAYNQNQERKIGTVYNGVPTGYIAGTNGIGALYKTMQFLYAGRKLKTGNVSFLALKDDFNKYRLVSGARVSDPGVWSRVTTGTYLTVSPLKKLNFTGSAYIQRGKDKDGAKLAAHLVSAAAMYAVTPLLSVGPGIDYTSGNNPVNTDGVNRRFDPLYGTPHKFWGLMDYFYVADGFGRSGLVNYYLKSRYKLKDNVVLSLDAHQFRASNNIVNSEGTTLDRNFGTELDLVLSANLTKVVNIEAGYATMFATSSLASVGVKNVSNPDLQANWAYLMINIKPNFLSK